MRILVNVFFLVLAWTSAQCTSQRDKVFFLQKSSDNETLLVVTWSESEHEISAGCEIFTDQDLIDEVLKSSGDVKIRTLSDNQMQNVLGDCTEFSLRRRRRDVDYETTTDMVTEDEHSTGLSIDDVNDPKGLRGNGNGQRQPQGQRRPQGQRQPQGQKPPQGQRSPQGQRQPQGQKPPQGQRSPQGQKPPQGQRPPQNQRPPQGQTQPEGREREDSGEPQEDPQGAPRWTSTTESDNEVITMLQEDPQEAPRRTSTAAPSTTPGYDGIPVIFPGTKWCGAGDRAKNYDDLGIHQDTDRCCRAHDLCNDTLAPGETRNNLTNKSSFTALSCKCDQDFYDCLARVNSVTSNTIGNTYFNLLRRPCYSKDYPLTKKCKKYRSFLKITCMEYEKDKSKPQVYQWKSAKKYKQIPFPGPLTVTLPF